MTEDYQKVTMDEVTTLTEDSEKGINRAKKRLLYICVNVCRLLLGLTFILSGFVKAIDPLGTQYKLEDYTEAIGLSAIIPDWLTLTGSMALSATEFCLGIFILFAIQRRMTSKLVLLFTAVMTCITVWLVIADPIKDCGCFGDALHLSNGQTLGKNVVLLAASILVAWRPLTMVRFVSKTNQWIVINYAVVFILGMSTYCLYKLPLFDFRPYHVGANIKKGMEIPEGAEQPEFETTFLLKKNGVTKEFTLDNYPDSTWEFIDSKTVQTKEGYQPPIHDFSIELRPTGEDITEDVLNDKAPILLLISPHLEYADDSNFGDIDQLYEYALEHHIKFYCLTASNEKAVRHWQDITGAEYPFCTTDETTLKTIVRSNPGLLLLRQGCVIAKWSHNSLPNFGKTDEAQVLKTTPQQALANRHYDDAKTIGWIVMWFFLPLFILTVTDRLWAWSQRIRRKKVIDLKIGDK